MNEELKESLKDVIQGLDESFSRLSLKENQFKHLPDPPMDLREQVESYMKIFGEDVNLETKLTRDLLSQNERFKEITDNHMHTGKYFNEFFKCEDDECICGKIHSPPQIFEK